MKKYIFLFILFLPVLARAQQSQYKSGLSDYMWMSIGNEGFTPGEAYGTCLAFSPSGIPQVAYRDVSNMNKATVMSYNGTFWDYLGIPGFSPGGVNYISFALSPNGESFIAFQDWNQSDKASVMKYNGTDWIYVGSPGISSDIASYTSLAINSAGVPFVAFGDKGHAWKATVMKYDGGDWVTVGFPGFSAGHVLYVRLAINESGVPYVAYSDNANENKVTVMKFEVDHWVNVGTTGFSAGEASSLSLAFNASGQPYISYMDVGYNTRANVMMFDGNQWVNVGPGGFSPQGVYSTSLAFSPTGEPYVAMEEFILTFLNPRAVVMKFDGMNWVEVGPHGFSKGKIDCPSLVFDPDGNPTLAYVDYGNGGKATVMTYHSVAVGVNKKTIPGLSLYPNPASTQLTVDLKTFTGSEVTYEITDIRGLHMTEARTSKNTITVDVNNYPPGIYFFRLNSANSCFVGKFCKN